MAVLIYKDGIEHRVEPLDLHNHLAQGYTLTNDPKPAELEVAVESSSIEVQMESNSDLDLEAARQLYFEKFGEKPHHKMKTETIMEKLNGNEPV